MEERLKYVFGLVNDWLKFAEAKIAAIIAFNGAAVLALIAAIKDIGNPFISYFIAHLTIPGLLVGLSIAFWGIKSNYSKSFVAKLPKPSNDDHILFFGDIAKYGDDEYLKFVYTRSEIKLPDETPLIELDIVCQTIINSRITLRKYQYANRALKATLITLIASSIAILPTYFSYSVRSFYTNTLNFDIDKYQKDDNTPCHC